jgi:hypothetical protein
MRTLIMMMLVVVMLAGCRVKLPWDHDDDVCSTATCASQQQ